MRSKTNNRVNNLIVILTFAIMAIYTSGCDINPQPYDGEQAILASIENSKRELNSVVNGIASEADDGYSRLDTERVKMEQAGMSEAEAKGNIVIACPALFNDIPTADIVGRDAVRARGRLEMAFDEAKQTDYSNRQQVNRAIKRLEGAWVELKPMLYSLRIYMRSLFADCVVSIEAILRAIPQLPQEAS